MATGDAGRVQVLVVGAALADVAAAGHAGDVTRASFGVVRNAEHALSALDVEPVSAVVARHDGPNSDAQRLLEALTGASAPAVVALVSDDGAPVDVLEAGATDYVSLAAARRDTRLLARRLPSIEDQGADLDKAWYRSLLERTTDVLTVLEADGTIRYASPSIRDVLGYEPAEMVGEAPFEYIHDGDLDRVVAAFESLLSGEADGTVEVQFRFEGADGEWTWMESVASTRPEAGIGGYVVSSREITERKQSDRELEHYETLLSVMPDTVVITDMDGVQQEIHGFEGWSGYEPSELVGEHVSTTTPEEYVERGESIVRELLPGEDKRQATYETRIETKDGDLIPFENHLTLLPPDEDGRIPGSMSVLRNIADRKERERRLEQAETVFQNAQDAVFLVDITDADRYEIRRINRSYAETTGLTAEDLQGRTPREIFGDEIGTRVEAKFRECADRRAPLDYEEELDLPGLPRHWHTRLAPVVVDDEVVGIVGATRNVTERKKREAELELKNRAMDEAPLGITIADATRPGRPIVSANDGFAELTGYDELEIRGRNLAALTGPETDERAFGDLERAMERAEPATAELLLHRADGSPVWTRLSVAPVTDDGGEPTHIVGFQQDISERKEYETEIERRFDEFSDILEAELHEPIATARSDLADAVADIDDARLESAADTLDRTERLLEDLTTVHSFAVPSREVSEATLLESGNGE